MFGSGIGHAKGIAIERRLIKRATGDRVFDNRPLTFIRVDGAFVSKVRDETVSFGQLQTDQFQIG